MKAEQLTRAGKIFLIHLERDANGIKPFIHPSVINAITKHNPPYRLITPKWWRTMSVSNEIVSADVRYPLNK